MKMVISTLTNKANQFNIYFKHYVCFRMTYGNMTILRLIKLLRKKYKDITYIVQVLRYFLNIITYFVITVFHTYTCLSKASDDIKTQVKISIHFLFLFLCLDISLLQLFGSIFKFALHNINLNELFYCLQLSMNHKVT